MSLQDLGTLTYKRTYAQDGEDYSATTERYLNFWKRRFPSLSNEIAAYGYAIHRKIAAPSMRAFQFAGPAIDKDEMRAFNCSFVAPQTWEDFGDISLLLCCGCGVGVGVSSWWSEELPEVPKTVTLEDPFVIPDTKEGWREALVKLLQNPSRLFDYSLIRPAGSKLVSTGGYASGPEPLKKGLDAIRLILHKAAGRQLLQSEISDIACHIASYVVAGGSRRSALIILFDDPEMAKFKTGNWWDTQPQRSQANISFMRERGDSRVEETIAMMFTPAGEPGIVLSHKHNISAPIGINPCAEISLLNRQFCNLSSIIAANCTDEFEFYFACEAAAFFGTLQASLTNFHTIDPRWKENTEKEALIGVSITGQAQAQWLQAQVLKKGAETVKRLNETFAKRIGINPAARCTAVKPEGTLSAVMGTTSGIHAAEGERVIRRVRVNRLSDLGKKLIELYGESDAPYSFVQTEVGKPENIVLQFPCKYENAIQLKDEGVLSFLKRAVMVRDNWVLPGHRDGQETHNVSITVKYHPHEEQDLKDWLLENQDKYRGISILPIKTLEYPQLPFEEVDEEEFAKYEKEYPVIAWEKLGVKSNRRGSIACSGVNGCEITSL